MPGVGHEGLKNAIVVYCGRHICVVVFEGSLTDHSILSDCVPLRKEIFEDLLLGDFPALEAWVGSRIKCMFKVINCDIAS